MQTTELFTVNGKPIPVPDGEVTFSFEDLDRYDAGRDQSGVMHRQPVRHMVGTWSFRYSFLTEAERKYLESLFPETGTFAFGHPDRLDTARTALCQAYRSQYALSWFRADQGIWKNYSFRIIEC